MIKLFSNLKQSVSRHSITANHLSKLSKAISENACVDPRNKQAGLILGTLTWNLVTKFKILHAYEQQVATFADLGIPVPDINHADKITSNGTSYHIIGISTCIGGENRSILLGIPPLGVDLTSKGLAKSIVEQRLKFYSMQDLQKLYMRCFVDGQYVLHKVQKEILKLLGFNIQERDLFHHYWWDSAHVIEMANSDLMFAVLLPEITDYYKAVGCGSSEVQNSTSYPWECDSAVENMINNLNIMATCLEASSYNYDQPLITYFNDCVKELLLYYTYHDSALFRRQVFLHNLRSKSAAEIHVDMELATTCQAKKLALLYRYYCNRMQARMAKMEVQT
ncbi:unnamed protein product [Allacma fusca]|uniref:Uncharacterized protein n=1 Tax=Allacma fusca TaxID=39272 RepID=A0A8J2NMS6_9HEXA|nr:unnamed protein product [Allacma fusca]